MKQLILSLLIFISLINSCTKYEDSFDCDFDISIYSGDSVINDSLSENYFQIWKTLLIKQSDMSEDYFNEHIIQTTVSSYKGIMGILFRVDYIFKIDWINIKCHDQFAIKMNSEYDPYQYLNIPRNVFFNQNEIEYNIVYNADSEISKYNLHENLKYDNCGEVCRAVVRASGYRNISPNYVSFYVPGNVPREDGDPYMMIDGLIDLSENRCLTGHINLITGECEIWESACWMSK